MSSSAAASGVFRAPALSASVSGFLDYVNASPSPFHACTASMALLDAAGFARISETATAGADAFAALQPGGKYYFTRNQSTIVAFAVGGKFEPVCVT
jgi:aspartyl aminopeptidase